MTAMASTAVASSSSSPPPYTGRWDYDVFVCFRGDDIQDNFMSHLEKDLSKMKIKTFVDTQLKVTQENRQTPLHPQRNSDFGGDILQKLREFVLVP
ncbi:unnamed protein product [Linum trigynum]|uniref:TIR domain-containing protein n=1 Tax=Linum trigynum TaxID=586398 RepID=A0AAV2FRP7_9ROSI